MYKRAESVLVVIFYLDAKDNMQVLLMNRKNRPGFWQSVTGSLEINEETKEAAIREIYEETGLIVNDGYLANKEFKDWKIIQKYEIFQQWQHRYSPNTTHNLEHFFSLQLFNQSAIKISEEHLEFKWLSWEEAAAMCFSWSNRNAILHLKHHFAKKK